jgi:hypothetical protein
LPLKHSVGRPSMAPTPCPPSQSEQVPPWRPRRRMAQSGPSLQFSLQPIDSDRTVSRRAADRPGASRMTHTGSRVCTATAAPGASANNRGHNCVIVRLISEIQLVSKPILTAMDSCPFFGFTLQVGCTYQPTFFVGQNIQSSATSAPHALPRSGPARSVIGSCRIAWCGTRLSGRLIGITPDPSARVVAAALAPIAARPSQPSGFEMLGLTGRAVGIEEIALDRHAAPQRIGESAPPPWGHSHQMRSILQWCIMKIGSRDEPAPAMMPPTKLWTLLCGLSSSVPPGPQNLQLIHDWPDCSVRSGGWYRRPIFSTVTAAWRGGQANY